MALDRTVSVKLKAEVAGYMASLKQAGAATSSFAQSIEKGAVKNKAHLDKLGNALAVVGTVAAAGVFLAVKAFADFDEAMSNVEAATHESAANMTLLRDASIEAGAKTAFSATEAAAAVEALAKAGVTTTDILSGGLTGAMDLAAAGSLDVGQAAEIAATAMTQFGLSGSDIPHIADLLAAGAGKAQGSVSDMAMALKQAGLVADQTGLTIEETTAGLASFASAGLIGSDAGTAFKSMLQRLTPQSSEAQAAMDDLNISAYDAGGNFIGLEAFAGNLKSSLAGLTVEQRNSAMATIFGSDAVRAAAVLYDQGSEGIAAWTDKVNDQGFAAETAALKMNNLSGDIEKLRGSLSSLLIKSGEGSDSFLRGAVQGAEDLVNALGRLSPETQKTILSTTALVAALALLGAGGIKAVTAFASLKASLAGTSLAANLTAASMGKLALATGGIVAAAIAADQLYAALGKAEVPTLEVNALADSMIQAGDSGKLGSEGIRLFGANSRIFRQDARDSDEALSALVTTMRTAGGTRVSDKLDRLLGDSGASMAKLTEQTTQADAALASMVTSGNGDAAAAQFHLIREAAIEAHFPLAKLNALFPTYSAATGGAGQSSEELAADLKLATAAAAATLPPIESLSVEQQGAAAAADEHAKAIDELIDNLNLLNGEAIDATKAAFAFEDSLRSLTKSVKDNGQSTASNTVKGQANTLAVIAAIEAANTHAEALGKQTGSTERATASFDRDVAALRRTALASGLSKAAVDRLIATYAKVPAAKQTKITAIGAETAAQLVNRLNRELRNLPRDVQTTIRMIRIEERNTRYKTTGQAPGKWASGGYITGAGGPTSDMIPAWLSNGEYVINAAATAANRSVLEAMNRGALARGDTVRSSPARYANGGAVAAAKVGPSRQVNLTGDFYGYTPRDVVAEINKQDRDAAAMTFHGGGN